MSAGCQRPLCLLCVLLCSLGAGHRTAHTVLFQGMPSLAVMPGLSQALVHNWCCADARC